MKMKEELQQAIKILKEGGIVIFPTDTAFGIGCRMDDENAVRRLFRIRNRPPDQAVPVLVNSKKMAQEYLLPISQEVEKLMDRYWPGALTIVFPCKNDLVPSLVRGGTKTLGVRLPSHRIPLALIENLGVPILGPSANFHGEETPYKFEDLDPEFVKLVDYTVLGKCKLGKASTVIDCTKKQWKILRQGAIKPDELIV